MILGLDAAKLLQFSDMCKRERDFFAFFRNFRSIILFFLRKNPLFFSLSGCSSVSALLSAWCDLMGWLMGGFGLVHGWFWAGLARLWAGSGVV